MTDSSSSRRQPTARRGAVSSKRKAPRAAQAPRRDAASGQAAPKTPEDMLRAGLKAFRLDRFMGWMPPAAEKAAHGLALPGLDPFGFRKFEDVFDQRVAGALAHLGWPDARALQAMQAEIEALRAEVDRLRQSHAAAPAKPAARQKSVGRKKPTKAA